MCVNRENLFFFSFFSSVGRCPDVICRAVVCWRGVGWGWPSGQRVQQILQEEVWVCDFSEETCKTNRKSSFISTSELPPGQGVTPKEELHQLGRHGFLPFPKFIQMCVRSVLIVKQWWSWPGVCILTYNIKELWQGLGGHEFILEGPEHALWRLVDGHVVVTDIFCQWEGPAPLRVAGGYFLYGQKKDNGREVSYSSLVSLVSFQTRN